MVLVERMKNLLSFRFSTYALTSLLALVVVFHILVIVGIIPYQIVWGGRIHDRTQLIPFEVLSILINIFLLLLVLIKAGFIPLKINASVLRIFIWFMAILFLFNTLGNLFSKNDFEKWIFTPLCLILAVLSTRLAVEKTRQSSNE